MNDWRGVPIAPGATVIYGVSQGSSGTELVVGEVVRERPATRSIRGYGEDKIVVRVTAQNRGYRDRERPTYVLPHLLTVVELPPANGETAPMGTQAYADASFLHELARTLHDDLGLQDVARRLGGIADRIEGRT